MSINAPRRCSEREDGVENSFWSYHLLADRVPSEVQTANRKRGDHMTDLEEVPRRWKACPAR